MEKRLKIILFLLLLTSLCFPQEYSTKRIRLYLWALPDAYPEIKEEVPYQQAKEHIIKLSEFLLTGMTYGWKFTYTPSDKLRNVDEFFECTSLRTFENDKKNIQYDGAHFGEEKIYYWINFERNTQMEYYYKKFSSTKNPKVKGLGKGKLSKGFSGLEEAAFNAVKNGIREYYRKIIKNKPKEITGTLLIRKNPAIFIDAGNYTVELDFFLETSKIKEYTQF